MDSNHSQSITESGICPVCHQPVMPQYYFCPNCGASLHPRPLSTSIISQAWLYSFSIILPIICFIFITKWQGIRYIKSTDQNAKKIGIIALSLLILSTIVTSWLVTVWIQQSINSSINSFTSASGYGIN